MDFRAAAPRQLSLALAARVIALGVLAYVLVHLLFTTDLYASALVVGVAALLLIIDLVRVIANADRSLERMLDSVAADVIGKAPQLRTRDTQLPFERAAKLLGQARIDQQQQLEHMQTLLDTVAAALIVVRTDERVSYANRAARKLGFTTGNRLSDIAVLGSSAVAALAALAPSTQSIVRLSDGQQVHVTLAQFAAPGRDPQRLISLQRITGELDAVELKAWQDMTRVLAHEMMNSLTPIASLSESLESLVRSAGTSNDSNEIAGALDAIRRRSLGLMSFVARYRTVAELPRPSVQSIDAASFLANIDTLMSAQFKDKAIGYVTRVAPHELSFQADPQLLEQALINLLRNAADAVCGAVEPRIELTCTWQESEVILTVADNGPGLSEEDLNQIFIPFFTSKPDGSGIGLSIARHVALAHGGKLEVTNNHPRGCVFSLSLPMAM